MHSSRIIFRGSSYDMTLLKEDLLARPLCDYVFSQKIDRREDISRRCRCGRNKMAHQPFSNKDDLKKEKCLEEHPCWDGSGLVWREPDDHSLFRNIHPFFYSSNNPGAESLVRHGIESIPSSNHQRRPLPSLLSDSSHTTIPSIDK